MKLGDVLHDSQSETGSAERTAALLVDTVETFEDPGLVFRGDPASVVRYGNDGGVPIAGQGQFDVGTAAVFDRIGNQIGERLFQKLDVARYGKRFRMDDPDRLAVLGSFLPE